MYSLKDGLEEYLSTMDINLPDKAKKILKHAWMAGAACVLKEFAKMYNRNPKAAIELVRQLGKDAHGYDQYKDDMRKQIHKDWKDKNPEQYDRMYKGDKPRYMDDHMYEKEHPMREKYPDIEADQDKYKYRQVSMAGVTTPDGKVYSADGKMYTYKDHVYYADGRMLQ